MFDLTLGGPVDLGSYDGPLLDGKPIHSGSCSDGVYGCAACNSAARYLTPEQRTAIGWPNDAGCDWCHRTFPFEEVRPIRPWDEPSVMYEVCGSCRDKHDEELRREREFDEEYDD